MASKANELVAIPQVLDLVEVAGSVVSIDAIGCQRAIATLTAERRADCVLALKQNQRALWEQVQAHPAPLLRQEPAFVSREKDHGHGEERRMWAEPLSSLGGRRGLRAGAGAGSRGGSTTVAAIT